MFAEESVRKHAELTERIKKEVTKRCRLLQTTEY